MNNYKKLLGNKLRELRKEKKFKTYKVAEIIGVNSGTYRNMEAGNHLPKSKHLLTLIKLYGLGDIENIVWDNSWDCEVFEKEEVLNYIQTLTKEIKEIKRNKKKEIEKNILQSIMLEVDDYRVDEFTYFTDGQDFLDIMESVKNEIEIRVRQLYNKYLNSKEPSEWKIGITPTGTKFKHKDI